MKLRKILHIFIFLILAACDGSDCIDPADFGNLRIKTFSLESNPYTFDNSKNVTGFVNNAAKGTSYSGYFKECGAIDISADSKGYFWLDTGVDIVSDRHNLYLKAAGAVDFCARSIIAQKTSDGQTEFQDNSQGCSEAYTTIYAHALPKNHLDAIKDDLDLDKEDWDLAKNYQPYLDDQKIGCDANQANEKSAYYVDNHNDFSISIPRTKQEPYYTVEELNKEVTDLYKQIGTGGSLPLEIARAKYRNSHSLKGARASIEYAKNDKLIGEAPSESRTWISRGEGIKVGIFAVGAGRDNSPMYNWVLRDNNIFDWNPAPPSGVEYKYHKVCCMKTNDAGECIRWDTNNGQKNGTPTPNRGYYEIDLDKSTKTVDPNLYSYCRQDVYRYKGPEITGVVKFKIDEDYRSCKNGNEEFCYCEEGKYDRKGHSCHSRHTGSEGSNCGIVWQEVKAEGCWAREQVTFMKIWRSVWKGKQLDTSTLHNNYGDYQITTRSSRSCIEGTRAIEFRIGPDIPENRRMATAEYGFIGGKYYDKPWNKGRLYARVVDQQILEREEKECYWTKNGRTVTQLKELYNNNQGNYRITVRTVKKDEKITRLKNEFFDRFNEIIIRDASELRDVTREKIAELRIEKNEAISNEERQQIQFEIDDQQRKLNYYEKTFMQRYHEAFVANPKFQGILSVLMALYIAVFGVSFLMGLSNMTQSDLVMRVLKIGIIYSLLLPDSWAFFNQFIISFEKAAEDIAILLAGTFIEKDTGVESSIYSLLDEIVYLFFQPVIHLKISAIFFSPILVGIILFFLIYYAFFLMLYAVAKSIVIYLVIKIIFTILFMVAPVFIIFALFEQTKQMFEQWLNMLISYSVQLIFLFLCIAFFSYLILDIFYDLFYYGVCWKPVWIIKLGFLPEFELFSFWRFWGFDPRYSEAYNVSKGPDFTSVLFFLAIAYCFKQVIAKITDLGNAIAGAGGVGAGSLAANMMKDTFSAIGNAMGWAGKKVAMPVAGAALHTGVAVTRGTIKEGYNLAKTGAIAATKGQSAAKENFFKNTNMGKVAGVFRTDPAKKASQQKAYDKAYKKATGSEKEKIAAGKKAAKKFEPSFSAKLLRAKDGLTNMADAIDKAHSRSMFSDPDKKLKRSLRATDYQNVIMDKRDKAMAKMNKLIDKGESVDKAREQFNRYLDAQGLHAEQLAKYNKQAGRELGERDIANKQKKLDNTKEKIQDLANKLKTKKEQEWNRELKDMKIKLGGLKAERADFDKDIDKLKQNLNNLEDKKEINKVSKEIADKEKVIKQKDIEIEKRQKELEENDIELLNQKAIQEEIAVDKAKLDGQEREKLDKELIEARDLPDGKEKVEKIQEAEKNIKTLEKKTNNNKMILTSYRTQSSRLKNKELDLTKQINNAKSKGEDGKAELAKLEAELSSVSGEISNLDSKINSAKANE